MPTPTSSIYRIIVIIQCLLITSLVLPGLIAPSTDSKLAQKAQPTFSRVNNDQLSHLSNPAALIDHLRFLERSTSNDFTVRDPSNQAVYRSPLVSSAAEAETWLSDATRSLGLGFNDGQPNVIESIHFKSGELNAWRLDIHNDQRAESALLTINITLQSLLLSTAVILLLGLIGARWITRPVESIEEQLLAIHHRRAHKLVAPRGNCSDFDSLIQTITDYVEDQQESRSRAGYASSLLEQVISTIETPIAVVDDNGTLRFSNRSGRHQFGLGTHPNAWTHLEFAQDPAIQSALTESQQEHHGVRIHTSSALPSSTMIHAITRGNDTPWMLLVGARISDQSHLEKPSSRQQTGIDNDSNFEHRDLIQTSGTNDHAVN